MRFHVANPVVVRFMVTEVCVAGIIRLKRTPPVVGTRSPTNSSSVVPPTIVVDPIAPVFASKLTSTASLSVGLQSKLDKPYTRLFTESNSTRARLPLVRGGELKFV